MKILELMCSLEEAYDRFGDIDIKIHIPSNGSSWSVPRTVNAANIIIESEEIIISGE